jgi:D-3-phosphoglycerate dehydrogenase
MRILAFDPYVEDWPAEVERTDLDPLLARSDFVICLAEHTDETENMIDASVFARMKPTAFFVNASRGGLVDETALEEALARRRIAGAALDVGKEAGDIPPLRLGRLDSVLATPHMAAGFEANREQGRQAIEAAAEILEGRIPESALNAGHATRMSRFRNG